MAHGEDPARPKGYLYKEYQKMMREKCLYEPCHMAEKLYPTCWVCVWQKQIDQQKEMGYKLLEYTSKEPS